MALQKRRRGPTRTRQQRSAWMRRSGENAPSVQSCPNCSAPKLPHKLCLQCGFYNGKQVTKAKAADAE